MGVIELFVYIVLIVLLAYVVVWVIGSLAPDHPKVIDSIIWVIAVLLIVIVVATALGLSGFDPQLPRLRRG